MHNRLIAATGAALVIMAISGAAPALASGNPSGTGPPSQSCQDIEAAGGTTPGNAARSPGSPFNEPGINSQNGGIGGQHYSERSQYDVACYHVSQH
ncbi:hypothetical protein GCM10022399_18840 [Terrabacter ginsenosidimutans]|jgi:hypothetical protein|uniref:Adenylate cyclase n=1 Tax=Terrabacter ginsenosidimutans TaxID=490575 RepID=A0ABP7DD47_9MICO